MKRIAIFGLLPLLILILTASGLVFRVKAFKAQRKNMRWIHTQRALTWVLLVFAIAGHVLIDYQ